MQNTPRNPSRFVACAAGILVNNTELLSGVCWVEVEFEDISSGHFALTTDNLL
jgi:hypothetical protein